jgi:SAM-dependent methyltransferase
MRSRIKQLAVLDEFLAGNGVTELPGAFRDDFELITGEGVTVNDTTLRAAIRYARFHDLDVVDLIPADLPAAALMDLVRQVNPATYRSDPIAVGRGAGQATLVRSSLLARVHLARTSEVDPVEYVETMVTLKKFAPRTTDLVIAPQLRAVVADVSWQMPRARALFGGVAVGVAAAPAISGAVLSAGPKASRAWGTAALAAYVAQPLIATGGLAAKPKDLKPHTILARPGRDVVGFVRALRAKPPARIAALAQRTEEQDVARREEYERLMEDQSSFLEARRVTCPWCGSDELKGLIDSPDLMQGKPGRFHLDECGSCQHVFQNPRLSIEGLDFYYKDFYDGLGGDMMSFVFSMTRKAYTGRAEMLVGVAEPKRWLDVGAGHGHFCVCAKEQWPETRFDALDLSDSVVEAERRGWVEQGYRGLFPDLASDLVGSYDVVSMHHYLEHTREPEEELDAAHTVLERGGHLLIEVPDPESRLGRRLGHLWVPWFQPQHQHFVPVGNLTEALQQRGFTIVAVERGDAQIGFDLSGFVWSLANKVAPKANWPWNPPTNKVRQTARAATFAAFIPLILAAGVADLVSMPIIRRLPNMTNAYRVLARKD